MKKLVFAALSLSLLVTACGDGGGGTPGDTTKPSVSLTAAQNGTTINLTASASDNVGVSKVEFYRGTSTTPFYTDSSSPFQASQTVSSADNGSIKYTAKAYDAAGNTAQASTSVNVYVARTGTKTLYQGVWGWAIGNVAGTTILDKGAAIFSENIPYQGRTVAGGVYANDTKGISGLAMLGPITATTPLSVGFTRSVTDPNAALYFIGIDDDDALGTYKGMPAFEGMGKLYNANNVAVADILIVLLQTSDTVPAGLQAQNTMLLKARNLAVESLKTMTPQKTNKSISISDVKNIMKSIHFH